MDKQSPQLRAVVFDLDGLMVNTEEMYIEVGERLLEPWGHSYCEELRHQMMGLPARKALGLMIDFHQLNITLEELAARSSALVDEHIEIRLEPMLGLFQLLGWLQENNIPKAIATSGTRSYARQIVERLNITDQFQFVLTADDVTHGKPHPEVYLLAANRLGLSADEMMVLEDSENGCRAGVASGAFTVAVPGDHNEGQVYQGVQFIAESLLDPRIREVLASRS